jgi:hypothetical protein
VLVRGRALCSTPMFASDSDREGPSRGNETDRGRARGSGGGGMRGIDELRGGVLVINEDDRLLDNPER